MNHYAICIKDGLSGFTNGKIYEVRFDHFNELFNNHTNNNQIFEQLGGCFITNDNEINIHIRTDFNLLYKRFIFIFNSDLSIGQIERIKDQRKALKEIAYFPKLNDTAQELYECRKIAADCLCRSKEKIEISSDLYDELTNEAKKFDNKSVNKLIEDILSAGLKRI